MYVSFKQIYGQNLLFCSSIKGFLSDVKPFITLPRLECAIYCEQSNFQITNCDIFVASNIECGYRFLYFYSKHEEQIMYSFVTIKSDSYNIILTNWFKKGVKLQGPVSMIHVLMLYKHVCSICYFQ